MQPAAADTGRPAGDGRWTGYQCWLVFLTALAVVFDGIDNQLMGVTMPAIIREWSVPRTSFAPVVSFGYLGMVTGGALAGVAGDRIGRRTALLASMLVFASMTLVTSFASSVAALAVWRCLAGVGLGGAIPNAAALAAEFVPLRQRPLAVTVTIVCVPLGATLAGLIAIHALPAFGWRALFMAGGIVPLVAAVALSRLLPESPRFLARHSADRAAPRASATTLFTPEYRADTVALWAAFFSGLLSVYLAFSWVPTLLTVAGFSPSLASAGITAFNVGGVVGALSGGVCVTRWGSRVSMLVMAGLAAASAAAMSAMPLAAGAPAAPVMVMLTITGALINGVQTTMYALAVYVYPAAIRATGAGSAVSFGRVGAVVSGYVGAWALDYHGAVSFFGVIAAAQVVCCLALASVRRHIPGSASVTPT